MIFGNRYLVAEKIGEGGMGAVYRGTDQKLEREVALKALRPEFAQQSEIVARFRSEAVLLARLNHPHIATLYDFHNEGNDFLMIMEYVPGETLEVLLKRHGRLPVVQSVTVMAQVLAAMAHAHQLGIVHRDLKPSNVMLTARGTIKVMDFGIAKVLGDAPALTREGQTVGTVHYMAPEQICGGVVDNRTDIYQLGVLFYRMLTGRLVFANGSEYEVMRAHVENAVVPPSLLVPDLPAHLNTAILIALAKDPEARFQSAEEFQSALLGGVSSPLSLELGEGNKQALITSLALPMNLSAPLQMLSAEDELEATEALFEAWPGDLATTPMLTLQLADDNQLPPSSVVLPTETAFPSDAPTEAVIPQLSSVAVATAPLPPPPLWEEAEPAAAVTPATPAVSVKNTVSPTKPLSAAAVSPGFSLKRPALGIIVASSLLLIAFVAMSSRQAERPAETNPTTARPENTTQDQPPEPVVTASPNATPSVAPSSASALPQPTATATAASSPVLNPVLNKDVSQAPDQPKASQAAVSQEAKQKAGRTGTTENAPAPAATPRPGKSLSRREAEAALAECMRQRLNGSNVACAQLPAAEVKSKKAVSAP